MVTRQVAVVSYKLVRDHYMNLTNAEPASLYLRKFNSVGAVYFSPNETLNTELVAFEKAIRNVQEFATSTDFLDQVRDRFSPDGRREFQQIWYPPLARLIELGRDRDDLESVREILASLKTQLETAFSLWDGFL